MAFNTNNPIPSSDPRDLSDNAGIFDLYINGTEERVNDRKGLPRWTPHAFNNLVVTAKAQIDPTVTAAKAAVNSARDAGIEDIGESVAAVDAAEAAAKAEMEATAAALGDDLNNKRFSTYAQMVAAPQTRDGVVAVVDADTDPAKNGWYYWNNTTKAWAYFLDQPLMSAAFNARLDVSEGVFSTIEEGLKHTRGTGLIRRYFRLTSTDQFYESRYRNDAGAATLMDRVLRDPARLPNVIPNGSFRNLGAGNRIYGDLFPASPKQTPIKATTDATLATIGCYAGFDCQATDSVGTGNFIEVDVSAIGFDKTLQVLASVVVWSANGMFDFGTHPAAGPAIYRTTKSGVEHGVIMTAYTELSSNVRVYRVLYRGFATPADDPIAYMRVGFNVVYPRSANLFVTGVWMSVDPIGYITSASRMLSDTTWPAWDTVDKTRSVDADIALSARVAALESPRKKALEELAEALRNPLHSPMIVLPGDSITAGTGADYNGEGQNNAKFNYAMKSWANLYRRYLGETYAEGAVIQNGSDGRYEKTNDIDMLGGDSRFKWIWNASGRYIPAPTPVLSESAKFGKYVDFGRNYRLEFDLTGNNITFIHSQYVSVNPAAVRIQVWDILTNTLLGQFSWAGDFVQMRKETTVTFPFGRYKIQLRDASTGTEFNFRLEGLRVKQQIQVRNIGISGSNTIDWLPGSVNLNQVRATDEFVFVMLGTNDRVNTTAPLNYSKTKDNLEAIVKHLIANGHKVILMCANVVLGNKEGPENPIYNYSMNDVLRACRQVAEKLGVDLIDNYTPTRKAVINDQNILSDLLHPNNAGHYIIYSNIIDRITSSEA